MTKNLKLLTVILLTLLTITAQAGDKKVKAEPEVSLENTWFKVTSKSCDGKELSMSSPESVMFANGMIIRLTQESDDEKSSCQKMEAFARVIGAGTSAGEMTYETGESLPQVKRIVCTDKATKATLSDKTESISGESSGYSMSFNRKGGRGSVALRSPAECATGQLILSISK